MYQDLVNTVNGKETAITFMQHKMSRTLLIKHIDNMAGFLHSIGIKNGDKVGIVAPNVPTAVIAFYAINKLGAISNIFHPLVAPLDLIKKLKATDTRVVFMYDLFYKKYKKLLKEYNITVIICSAKDYLDSFTKFIFSIGLDPIRGIIKDEYTVADFRKEYTSKVSFNENACLLHSSGTDREKTVILTNQDFIELRKKMLKVVGEENFAKETTLVSLPIFHCFGLGVGIHTSLCVGADIVLMPTFNPKAMVRLVKQEKVTTLIVIPSMVKKFISYGFNKNFKTVKHIYCGGDKLNEQVRKKFNTELHEYKDINILEGYGLTELTGVCVVNTEKEYREGSIGKPIDGIEALIIDENNNPKGLNVVGELALSSNTMMKSYYDGTKNTFMYNGKEFLKTGDLAKQDEDGFLYFMGRQKETIRIGGTNVFPRDIEDLVAKFTGIKEVICLEKDINNKPYIYLYVQANEETEELKEKIRNVISENMLKYCMPKEIIFINKWPLNKNGKIDKKALLNM